MTEARVIIVEEPLGTVHACLECGRPLDGPHDRRDKQMCYRCWSEAHT